MTRVFTAYIEYDPETKLYVGIIPNVSVAHTQGANLDELQKKLKEVLELCLEEMAFNNLINYLSTLTNKDIKAVLNQREQVNINEKFPLEIKDKLLSKLYQK